MMKCPSCNKFASFDIQEPEVNTLDINEDGQVTGDVRLVLNTQCCGDEAKETTFDIDVDLSDEIVEALKAGGIADPDLSLEGVSLEVEEQGTVGDERYESKDRRGKTIKNPRYMKKFYVAEVTIAVTCAYPVKGKDPVKVEVTHEWRDEVQASGMDEL